MELSQFLGYVATFLFSFLMVPQVIKTIKRNSVKDISLSMLLISLVANGVALWYALLIHQAPLITKYILAGLVMLGYVGLYFKIKSKEEKVGRSQYETKCTNH